MRPHASEEIQLLDMLVVEADDFFARERAQFGYTKVRFRGLAKNAAQMVTLFSLSYLWMARRHLLTIQVSVSVMREMAAARCSRWKNRGKRE